VESACSPVVGPFVECASTQNPLCRARRQSTDFAGFSCAGERDPDDCKPSLGAEIA
jgi:hypothetical protein